MNDWAAKLNKIDKCRQLAYFAKSVWAREYWCEVADELELKWCSGQPWLRTFDGKSK
jgi:hypothetical protein